MTLSRNRWIHCFVEQISDSVDGLVEQAPGITAFIDLRKQSGPVWDFQKQLDARMGVIYRKRREENEADIEIPPSRLYQPTVEDDVRVEDSAQAPPVEDQVDQGLEASNDGRYSVASVSDLSGRLHSVGVEPAKYEVVRYGQRTPHIQIHHNAAEDRYQRRHSGLTPGLPNDVQSISNNYRARYHRPRPGSPWRRPLVEEPRTDSPPRTAQYNQPDATEWMRLHTLREERSVLEKKLELARLEAERDKMGLHAVMDKDPQPSVWEQKSNPLLFKAIDEEQHRLELKEYIEDITAQTRQDTERTLSRTEARLADAKEIYHKENDAIIKLMRRERNILLERMDSKIDEAILQVTGTSRIPVGGRRKERARSEPRQLDLSRSNAHVSRAVQGRQRNDRVQMTVDPSRSPNRKLQMEIEMRNVLTETGFNEHQINGIIHSRVFEFETRPTQKDSLGAQKQMKDTKLPNTTGKWRQKVGKVLLKTSMKLHPQDLGNQESHREKHKHDDSQAMPDEKGTQQVSVRQNTDQQKHEPLNKPNQPSRLPRPASPAKAFHDGHGQNGESSLVKEDLGVGEYEEIQVPRRLLSPQTLRQYGLPWNLHEVSL